MTENLREHITELINVIDSVSLLQRVTSEKAEAKRYLRERLRRRHRNEDEKLHSRRMHRNHNQSTREDLHVMSIKTRSEIRIVQISTHLFQSKKKYKRLRVHTTF